MKGQLLKSKALKDEWMVRYTTYKTIPGIKGVIGSHSRIPESNYIPLHPEDMFYLCPGDNGQTIDFEITEIIAPVEDGTTMFKCAKLINEEKHTKRSKQKKAVTQEIVDEAMRITGKDVRAPKCVRDGIVKRVYTEEDLRKAFKYGVDMEAGLVSFEYKKYPDGFSQFINSLNKQDNE